MKAHERAIRLGAQGKVHEAKAALDAAIASGDGDAAFVLANWRVEGLLVRRDLVEARSLFALAAERGCAAANEPLAALLATGPGGLERDWQGALDVLARERERIASATRQLELIGSMPLTADGDPVGDYRPAIVSQDPLIAHFPDFLTVAECDALIALAEPVLAPSRVVHPQTGALVLDSIRTSSAAAFPLLQETPFLHAINRRIARASRSRWEQGEPTQVLHYRPGEEYKLHSDALNAGNQRIQTFLIYLNDGFEGGETYFPHGDLRLRFPRGHAICFSNVAQDMRPLRTAVHAGLPVSSGNKIVLSKWIRAQPLDLTGPPGKPF